MPNIQDYFLSTEPAKLMLLDGDGKETGDYLNVIALDAAKVSRQRSQWTAQRVKLDREVKEINDRAVDDDILTEDLERKADITTFEISDLSVEFAMNLIAGSSFDGATDDDIRELLQQGNIADAVIALAADADRLKKKHK